jgi:5S rRNA maturation endonuclease (ribonuclease M5)
MEFISLKPKITKDFILSKVNQESIMQHFTGLDVSSKKLALSPLRQDNHITVGFYKSKSGILYMHDFATNEHLDCWNVVMRLYNCSFYKALNIIANDFGLSDTNIVPTKINIIPEIKETESSIIQVQIKDFTDRELEWWKSFGINKKTLKKYHIFSVQHVFLNGELKFTSSEQCPIYGYYFGKDKNKKEFWKIYFPMNKNKGIRFINNLPKKILQGYHQLPKNGDLLVITKSMKDLCAMYEFGISAVSTASESTFISDKQLEEFKSRFKHIIVIFDSDRPGKHNMWLIRKKYPELNYYVLPNTLEKDFTDSIKKIGINKMKELVNQFMSNYKFK